MQPSATRLSDRAIAILGGLVRSQKISPMPPGAGNLALGYLRLDRSAGGFYWLALSGSDLRRGAGGPDEADILADSFVEAMARLGTPRRSAMEIPPLAPQSCLSKIA
jgi:hypothetical protein